MALPDSSESITDVTEDIIDEVNTSTNTWYIDPYTNKMTGMIEGEAALKQMLEYLFETHLGSLDLGISNWGVNLEGLVGQSKDYIVSETLFRLQEAIKVDARIIEIGLDTEVPFELVEPDGIKLNLIVNTIYGDIETEMEVNI